MLFIRGMKNNFLFFIPLIFIFACVRNKNKISVNLANPLKPIIAVKLSSDRISSLYTSNNTISIEKANSILSLHLVADNITSNHSIIGTYFIENDSLKFIPYFDLGNELNFESRFYVDRDTVKKRFSTPKTIISDSIITEVVSVFPLTNRIPANILSFHILFTSPMQEDVKAFAKIHLLDEKGNIKPKVWKERSYWADSARHLILMIHPGRIKRGIHYLENLGPIFEVGKKYTLVVSTQLKTEYGKFITKEYKKEFLAIAPDRNIPKIINSDFKTPQSIKAPLQLSFSEPIDYASLCIGLKIIDSKNELVKYKVRSVRNSDSVWECIPIESWKKQKYTVEFNEEITDLASNHLYRLFETKELKAYYKSKPIKWSFRVK